MVVRYKKKGIGYTFFVILSLYMLIIYLTYDLSSKTRYIESTSSYIHKGYTLKEIKTGFERDFPRSVDVAFKRALVELINNETYEGSFYQNVEDILFNLSYYGYYDGFNRDFLINSTIKDWIAKYKSITSLKSISLNVQINNHSISLEDYDHMKVCYNLSYYIIDAFNQQGYNIKDEIICSSILLENFEDPFITIKSYENIISSFKLCNSTSGIENGNGFYGIAYIPTSNDLSFIENKDKYILVVENLSSYSNYDGFKGYVLKYNTSLLYNNYIYGVNISMIQNNTFIAVSSNKVWLTGIKNNERVITCYFPWDEGINFLDRLKGDITSSAYKVAAIVDPDLLPPELNNGKDYDLDVNIFG